LVHSNSAVALKYQDDEHHWVSLQSQLDWNEALLLLKEAKIDVFKIQVSDGHVTESESEHKSVSEEPELPPLHEIILKLRELALTDDAFRGDLPNAAKYAVQAWLDGSDLKSTVLSILDNCPAISGNEFVASLNVPANWEKIVNCGADPSGLFTSDFANVGRNEMFPATALFGGFPLNFMGLNGGFGRGGCKGRRFRFCNKSHAEGPAAVVKLDISSKFVSDVNYEDGTELKSDFGLIAKSWRLVNNGNLSWPEGTRVTVVDGDKDALYQPSFEAPIAKPDEEVEVSVVLRISEGSRRIKTVFQLHDAFGIPFGDKFWIDISVL